jgi:hypothetical protein
MVIMGGNDIKIAREQFQKKTHQMTPRPSGVIFEIQIVYVYYDLALEDVFQEKRRQTGIRHGFESKYPVWTK